MPGICSGKKSICVNTLGSYKCKRPGQTSNYGIGYGDPHFSVQTPGEDPICFDFHGFGGDIYTLLFEPSINLIANAEFQGTVRKSWMQQIGVKTQDGNEILITAEQINISRHGKPLTSMKFDRNQKEILNDVVVDVRRDTHHEKHLAFLRIKNGPTVQIHVHNGHLGFNVVEPHMLRQPTGIVGSLLQPGSYHIEGDNVVVKAKNTDTTQTVTYSLPAQLIKTNKCHKIMSQSLDTLYQLDTHEFLVKSIFTTSERLNPKLLTSSSPK